MFDPVFFISRVVNTINMDAPGDKVAMWNARSELLTKSMLASFSFNFWLENKMQPYEYSYDEEFSKNTVYNHDSAARAKDLPYSVRQVGVKSADYFFKYGTKGSAPSLGSGFYSKPKSKKEE